MPNLREEITKSFRRLRGAAEPTVAASNPREGHQFGAYRILRHLGSGGMGHVYLALDTRLGRQVALKFLPRRPHLDDEMLRRLEQEARTASALNHPNILTIYEIGEIDGEHFIASEYIDGITLRTAMQRGPSMPARPSISPSRLRPL